MNYLVVECHLSYAVVLDEEGRFIKAANLHYEVGQMVTDIIEMQAADPKSRSFKKAHYRWLRSMAVIAACLVLMAVPLRLAQIPYASVYMAINPEVRIDVNRKDVVIGVDGINDDGISLVENYYYKKKNLELVMDELVDRAIDAGFLHEGGQITLTLDAEDGEWVVNRGGTLSTNLNEHLREKMSVTIEVKDRSANRHEVILPVGPGNGSPDSEATDSGYGESDYGDGQSFYDEPDRGGGTDYGKPEDGGQTDYDEPGDDGLTNYSEPGDDGLTDYDEPGDDGLTDYGEPEDDGLTDYDEPEDDGQTDYGEPEDDGQTDYDEPDSGGHSGYGTADNTQTNSDTADDNGRTDYDENDDGGQTDGHIDDSDDGQTDYGEPEDDDGQSDYDFSDDDD